MQKILYTIFCLTILVSTVMAEETFLSLKKGKVNVRYGPSFDSDVKYVYKKINLPIKQIDKKENFRRIIDLKNNSGWIHISQLKKINSVISTNDKIKFINLSGNLLTFRALLSILMTLTCKINLIK